MIGRSPPARPCARIALAAFATPVSVLQRGRRARLSLPRSRARRTLPTHCAIGAVAVALLAPLAHAEPPTRDEIVQWCSDTEDTAECLRVIESHQLKKLPGLATRNGGELRVTLFPNGSTVFSDVEALTGGMSFSLWDNWSPLNAVVVAVTRDDHTTYELLLRGNGKRFALPAEPVLAPDRQHLVTADFCAVGCANELVIWRVSREEVAKRSTWRPAPTWSDVVVGWKDAQTLSIEFTPMGASEPKRETRSLDDVVFRGK